MNLNRQRPPKGCDDLGVWLVGVVADAFRDATNGGLPEDEAVVLVRTTIELLATQRHVTGDDESSIVALVIGPSERDSDEELKQRCKARLSGIGQAIDMTAPDYCTACDGPCRAAPRHGTDEVT